MTGAQNVYTGSCHCGQVRFRFDSAPITAGKRCNCSVCTRKNAIMSVPYFPPDAFLELTGLESLAVYRFGDRMVNHYFCPRCGIYPFHDTTEQPGHFRINLGYIDGLDLQALTIEHIDGRAF